MQDSAARLKGLQVQEANTKKEIAEVGKQIAELAKTREFLLQKLKGAEISLQITQEEMRILTDPEKPIVISEHAFLRYLERVNGINLEEIRKEILTDNVVKLIRLSKKEGKIPLGELKLQLKSGVITTIT